MGKEKVLQAEDGPGQKTAWSLRRGLDQGPRLRTASRG